MTVAELKKLLEQYNDDDVVFYRYPDIMIGTIGEIFNIKQSIYAFFGKKLPCVILSADNKCEEDDHNLNLPGRF